MLHTINPHPVYEPSKNSSRLYKVYTTDPEEEERPTPPVPGYLRALTGVMMIGVTFGGHAAAETGGGIITQTEMTPTGIELAHSPLARRLALVKQKLRHYSEQGSTPYAVVPNGEVIDLVDRILETFRKTGKAPDNLSITADESFVIDAGPVTVEVFFNGDIVYERRRPELTPVLLDVAEEELYTYLIR